MSEKDVRKIKKSFEKEFDRIAKRITAELKPLLESMKTMDKDSESFKLFRLALSEFGKKIDRVRPLMDIILDGLEEISKLGSKGDLYTLFAYFGIIESWGNALSDFVVMLLVANGRDFHIECRHTTPRIKHAHSIKDLERERVPLTTKLNFMKENGVSQLASIIDNKFRNDFAHMKFSVKEGKIFMRKKRARVAANISAQKLLLALETISGLIAQEIDFFEQ